MRRDQKTANSIAAFWGKSLNEPNNWYSMSHDGDDAEIRIYDVIGWPFIDADMFLNELARIDAAHISVRINSPGGDVMDGTAIFNALQDHPAKITTRVEGLAASMASIISLAGDKVEIAKNAYYMIHNPWSFAFGDYRDMNKTADLLERIAKTLADIYVSKTGSKIVDIRNMMDEETWLIGQEAIDAGFADALTSRTATTAAKFDLSIFNHAPNAGAPNKRDLEHLLTQDAGLSRSQARAFLKDGYKGINTQDADDHNFTEATKFIKSMQEKSSGN